MDSYVPIRVVSISLVAPPIPIAAAGVCRWRGEGWGRVDVRREQDGGWGGPAELGLEGRDGVGGRGLGHALRERGVLGWPARYAASKVSGWPARCKLAQAFLWEYSYKRPMLAQLLGQLGVFLTLRTRPRPHVCVPNERAARPPIGDTSTRHAAARATSAP